LGVIALWMRTPKNVALQGLRRLENKRRLSSFEILLKSFECFISHVTTSETEMKLFLPLKEF